MTTPAAPPQPRDLVLIGGGDHAMVVMDAAMSQPGEWRLIGFLDPDPEARLARQGVRWLGDDADGTALEGPYCLIAVGGVAHTTRRRAIHDRYAGRVRWATVVHHRAVVSSAALVEPGAVVLAGALVNSGAQVGAHAIVGTGAIVEHDVVLDQFVHVGPGAVLGGGVAVGTGAYIGMGARVRDHVRIGPEAVIGMGAVVLDTVPPRTVAVGVPARVRDLDDGDEKGHASAGRLA